VNRAVRFPAKAGVIESLLCLIIVAGLVSCVVALCREGYLPSPFFYHADDDLMDWYNTAYWAQHPGAYDVWQTIYPPISFVFLKVLSLHSCYAMDPLLGRGCDWMGRAAMLTLYAANGLIALACYWRRDRRTAAFRTLALMLGFPMLCALDRGNLVIACFTFFALGLGGLLASARWRWLAIALSINFKPYVIAAVAPWVLRRRWRWLLGLAIAVLGVYVASYVSLGEGNPVQILTNELIWAIAPGRSYFEAFYAASSFKSVIAYVDHSVLIHDVFGPGGAALMTRLGTILVVLGQVGAAAVFAAVAFGRRAERRRVAALAVSLVLTTTEIGAYADIFLLFLVFLEPWRGRAAVVALVCAYLICIPADIALATLGHRTEFSYLTQRSVDVAVTLNLGSFARPALVLIIQYALIAAIVGEMRQAHGAERRRRARAEGALPRHTVAAGPPLSP